MTWLTDNWFYLLLLAGVLFFMMRRGGMGCAMGGHGQHGQSGQPGEVGQDHAHHADAGQATDPVSGEAVPPGSVLVATHGGRLYHFASRENRDRFEAAPDKYATAGAPSAAAAHRHHGC